jgi:hypothetical protein
MSAHPTPEELADLAEGLLGDDDAHALDAHVAGCPACLAVRADLDDLRALLAADRPGPMPIDLADRLDAALASAASAADLSPTPAVIMQFPGVIPRPGSERGRRAGSAHGQRTGRWYVRLAGAAAGLVLVVGGSVLGLQVLRDQNAAQGGGTSSSAERATGLAEKDSGLDAGKGSGQPVAGAPGPAVASSSGRTYTEAGFAGQVAALLRSVTADGAGSPAPAGPPREGAGGAAAAEARTAAMACAAQLAAQTGRPGDSPLAVDVGRWNGDPALIVVLPETGTSAAVHAYVVTPDCATGPTGRVVPLHDQVLPRP